jgi:hypothetical protein
MFTDLVMVGRPNAFGHLSLTVHAFLLTPDEAPTAHPRPTLNPLSARETSGKPQDTPVLFGSPLSPTTRGQPVSGEALAGPFEANQVSRPVAAEPQARDLVFANPDEQPGGWISSDVDLLALKLGGGERREALCSFWPPRMVALLLRAGPRPQCLYVRPQLPAALLVRGRQLSQRGRLPQARQVKVVLPVPEGLFDPSAILGRGARLFGPDLQVCPQPRQGLLPPASALLGIELGRVSPLTRTDEGRCASSLVAMGGLQIVRQFRLSRKRLLIEPGRRSREPFDTKEMGELGPFGRVAGLHLTAKDGQD